MAAPSLSTLVITGCTLLALATLLLPSSPASSSPGTAQTARRVALCICGTTRTFHYRSVATNILTNVLEPILREQFVDVFFVVSTSDVGKPSHHNETQSTSLSVVESSMQRFRPISTSFYSVDGSDWPSFVKKSNSSIPLAQRPAQCVAHDDTHPSSYSRETVDFSHTLLRTAQCLKEIRKEEARQHMKYTHVYRIRPDVVYSSPLPPPSAISSSGQPPTLHTSAWHSREQNAFNEYWTSLHQSSEQGSSQLGDHVFIAERHVADMAMDLMHAFTDCETYHLPNGRIATIMRLALSNRQITYVAHPWVFAIVRAANSDMCDHVHGEMYESLGRSGALKECREVMKRMKKKMRAEENTF